MKIESFGKTDIGLVRLNNEDVFLTLPKQQCFLLADGMGGHQAGEIAAKETVTYLSKQIIEASRSPLSDEEWIEQIDAEIRKVNSRIFSLGAQDKEKEGMGTTLCLALINNQTLIYAHVGDSRIYRIRSGRITQLTHDHSLKDQLLASGELDEELAHSFPYKNVITRAIGTQKEVTPEIHTTEINPGDLYLLCSDGLTDGLSDEQIHNAVLGANSLRQSTDDLILEAKKAGGNDNITVVMISIK